MHFWVPEAWLETPEVFLKLAGDFSHRIRREKGPRPGRDAGGPPLMQGIISFSFPSFSCLSRSTRLVPKTTWQCSQRWVEGRPESSGVPAGTHPFFRVIR